MLLASWLPTLTTVLLTKPPAVSFPPCCRNVISLLIYVFVPVRSLLLKDLLSIRVNPVFSGFYRFFPVFFGSLLGLGAMHPISSILRLFKNLQIKKSNFDQLPVLISGFCIKPEMTAK